MRNRGQGAHRANTVGHSRSNMRHEISGCLKRIGSSLLVVFVMSALTPVALMMLQRSL